MCTNSIIKNISINDSTHNSKSLINTLFIFRSLASDYLMSKSYCQTKGPEDDQKTKGKSKKKRKKDKVDSLGKDFEFALWSPHVTMKIKGHGTNQAQNSTSAY